MSGSFSPMTKKLSNNKCKAILYYQTSMRFCFLIRYKNVILYIEVFLRRDSARTTALLMEK